MVLPDVRVSPGTDPTVIKQAGKLSGFESWQPSQVEGFCLFVAEEARTLLGRAPKEVVDAFAPTVDINLYCHKMQDGTVASVVGKQGQLRADVNIPEQSVRMHGYEKPTQDGLCISTDPNADWEQSRSVIGHELLHWFTSFALHEHWRAPWEAVVSRLEKEYYGERRFFTEGEAKFDPSRFLSTTGLCARDFATIDFDQTSYKALYLSTYFDLDHVRAETVWSIVQVLTERYRATGLMPLQSDIHAALLTEAQEAGAKALQKPSFAPMKPGHQLLCFPYEQERGARCLSFFANARPDYGVFDPQKMWLQSKLYECKGVPFPELPHRAFDKKGNMMKQVFGIAYGEPEIDISYAGFNKSVERLGQRGKELAAQFGDVAQIEIPTAGTLTVRKNA